MVVHLLHTEQSASSTLVITTKIRSVAQPGSAPALGAGGPRFESLYSDHFYGVVSVTVNTTDCDSVNTGSIPVRLPKAQDK